MIYRLLLVNYSYNWKPFFSNKAGSNLLTKWLISSKIMMPKSFYSVRPCCFSQSSSFYSGVLISNLHIILQLPYSKLCFTASSAVTTFCELYNIVSYTLISNSVQLIRFVLTVQIPYRNPETIV